MITDPRRQKKKKKPVRSWRLSRTNDVVEATINRGYIFGSQIYYGALPQLMILRISELKCFGLQVQFNQQAGSGPPERLRSRPENCPREDTVPKMKARPFGLCFTSHGASRLGACMCIRRCSFDLDSEALFTSLTGGCDGLDDLCCCKGLYFPHDGFDCLMKHLAALLISREAAFSERGFVIHYLRLGDRSRTIRTVDV